LYELDSKIRVTYYYVFSCIILYPEALRLLVFVNTKIVLLFFTCTESFGNGMDSPENCLASMLGHCFLKVFIKSGIGSEAINFLSCKIKRHIYLVSYRTKYYYICSLIHIVCTQQLRLINISFDEHYIHTTGGGGGNTFT